MPKKTPTGEHIIFKLQNIKDKEENVKEARGKNTLPLEEENKNYI